MSDDLQKRIANAISNPQNMGEMAGADAVGTVGNAGCGDALRMWIKFRQEGGRKVIDRATFQSFGCETAIAAASLATELIRGKTPEEALKMSGQELAADLGPLPPTKVHCTQLVEDALRSALESTMAEVQAKPAAQATAPAPVAANSLLDNITKSGQSGSGVKLVFLDKKPGAPKA